MNTNAYMLLPVIAPALAGVFVSRVPDKRRAIYGLCALFACAAVSLGALFLDSGARFTVWRVTDAISVSFSLDGLSRFYVCLVSFVWAMAGLYALSYFERDERAYRFWRYYLLSYAALMGLSMSDNLITLYMFYEGMTLLTVPLVAHDMDKRAVAAAIKYLIYSVFGASLALLGIFFVGAYAGEFAFRPGGLFAPGALNGREGLMLTIFFLMTLGFCVKAGMFPMHSWLPTAHPVAPAPASAVLSGVITKMGVLGVARTVFYVAGAELLRGTWAQYALMALSLITVVMGSVLAYWEKGLKKRLAYSTVSQVSYVLFGLFTLTEAGFIGALLHVVFHSLIKDTLFMSAGAVIHQTGKTEVSELTGIGKIMPATMALFTVVSLGLIGIPPTGGFISKWNLAEGALSMGVSYGWIGPAALLLSAVFTAGYLLSLSIRAFFPGDSLKHYEKREADARMLAPMGLMAVLSVMLGMFPSGLIDCLTRIAGAIF